jgi:1,4-dihydroxy-2-naphthoate polyprenyltransferase
MERVSGAPARAAARPRTAALVLRATRPLYLPTSLLPGLAGMLVALDSDDARWWLAPVAIVALLFVHAGTNVINDVEDYARGVDAADKMDNSRVFNTGLMSVAAGRRLAFGFFGAAFLLGVGMSVIQGPALLAIGLVGILGGLGYSAGPRPLKFAGLGDVAIVLLMGPLLTQGAYTAVTGDGFHAQAFWLGFGPGFLIACVLAGNNLSDIEGDRAAGVRTLAVRLGFGPARALVLATLGLAYGSPVAVWAAGLLDWPVLLPLLTLPIAVGRAAQALSARRAGDPLLVTLAPRTAQLHLLFCALLVAGVALAEA